MNTINAYILSNENAMPYIEFETRNKEQELVIQNIYIQMINIIHRTL